MLLTQPTVEFHWLRVGHCHQLEALSRRGGALKRIEFPSYVAAIRHREAGWILYDTGYAEEFFTATAKLPARLYRATLPVTLDPAEHLTTQLADLGVTPHDVARVVVSHFHGDHVAGLRDLPAARISAGRAGLAQIQGSSGLAATRHGLVPALLPDDVDERFDAVEDLPGVGIGPFMGRDLLGDQSLVAVELPGHMPGHLGLLLTTDRGQVLLAGDAAWSTRAIRDDTPPSRLAGPALHDAAGTAATLHRLHDLAEAHPDVTLLPSHCVEAADAWNAT
ncbi:MAG: hypothetical protein JWO46_3389 [Nocardioidaceae bacterium]|nr:hypothetical protein [Nocardioidaceae bacterium]